MPDVPTDIAAEESRATLADAGCALRSVTDRPCATCPFRVANHDKRDGTSWDAIYTRARRDLVWSGPWEGGEGTGLRHGGMLLCHRTGAPIRGGKNPHASGPPRPCASAVVLQQREVFRFRREGFDYFNSAHGMTVAGIKRAASAMLHGEGARAKPTTDLSLVLGADFGAMREAAHPALTDPAIGHHALPPVTDGEFSE